MRRAIRYYTREQDAGHRVNIHDGVNSPNISQLRTCMAAMRQLS